MGTARDIFTDDWADAVFPPERTDAFFEALYDGAEEGVFDIRLRFVESNDTTFEFAFELHARPGHCLVCHITYGLPHVFTRHPIINLKEIVADIATALGKTAADVQWEIKPTEKVTTTLFRIPLTVNYI